MAETTIREQLEQLDYPQLQELAKAASVLATGKAAHLRERLAGHYEAEGITVVPALPADDESADQDGPEPAESAPRAGEPTETADEPQAGPQAPVVDDEAPADDEQLHTYRAVRPMMERDGRTPIRQGQLFQATASDPRTRHARRVDPELSPEQAAVLEALDSDS